MYLDSAILVKLVVRESDSVFYADMVDGQIVWSAELALSECFSALLRKEREGSITTRHRQAALATDGRRSQASPPEFGGYHFVRFSSGPMPSWPAVTRTWPCAPSMPSTWPPPHNALPGRCVPTTTTAPLVVRGPELLQMAPVTTVASSEQPIAAAVMSLSDLRMTEGSVTLPPVNETGLFNFALGRRRRGRREAATRQQDRWMEGIR